MSFLDEVETSVANYRILDALNQSQGDKRIIKERTLRSVSSQLNLLANNCPLIEELINEIRSQHVETFFESFWNPNSLLFYCFHHYLSSLEDQELTVDFINLAYLINQFNHSINECHRRMIANFIVKYHLDTSNQERNNGGEGKIQSQKGGKRRASQDYLSAPVSNSVVQNDGNNRFISRKLVDSCKEESLESLCQTAAELDSHMLCQHLTSQYDQVNTSLLTNLNLPLTLFSSLQSAAFDHLKSLFVDFLHSSLFDQYALFIEFTRRQVELSSFTVFRVIGRGAFGSIWAVQRKSTGAVYALKELNKYLVKSRHSERFVLSEKEILSQMNSPFVLSLIHSFHSTDCCYLLFPLLSGGDLRFHLNQKKKFSIAEVQFFTAQLLLGLAEIHSRGFVYRDLKPENILLDEDGNCCIIDLGLAIKWEKGKEKEVQELAGTCGYWAPEILSRTATHPVCDYWSLAVVIFELISGRLPKCHCKRGSLDWCTFSGNSLMDQNARSSEGTPMFDIRYGQSTSPDQSTAEPNSRSPSTNHQSLEASSEHSEASSNDGLFSPDLIDLLSKMFTVQFDQRLGYEYGIESYKNHPFFHSIDWIALERKVLKPPFQPESDQIHANSIGEIGEFQLEKVKKSTKLNESDQLFYRSFPCSIASKVEEELVNWLENMEKYGSVQKKSSKGNSSNNNCKSNSFDGKFSHSESHCQSNKSSACCVVS
jgi:serine/threonine protein kinase